MTLQEKIQKKAELFGELAPVFLEGAKFALENQWISVDEDLPCNISKIIHFGFTNKVLVIDEYKNIFIAYMERNRSNEWIWRCDDNFSVLHTITHWKPIPYLQEE